MQVIRADRRDEWIPPVDAEIFNEQMHLNALSDILQQDIKANFVKSFLKRRELPADAQEYLVLGMSKGSVYLVNTFKLDKIYARVTVSRAAITHVEYAPRAKLFLTICAEGNLTVWSLDSSKDGRREKRLNTLYCTKLYRQVKHIKLLPCVAASAETAAEENNQSALS
jgi:hypothetical protein